MLENFEPKFKESSRLGQFEFINGEWIHCSEGRINSMWLRWCSHIAAHRYRDEEGFIVYGYKTQD